MINRLWRIIAICLLVLTSGAWASKPDFEPRAVMVDVNEPIKIGETKMLPISITYMPEGVKSGVITFELYERFPLREGVKASFVKIKEATIDPTKRAPIIYVPITVVGEGMFEFKGNMHVQMNETITIFEYNKDYFDWPYLQFAIFAFDEKVFFARTREQAVEKMAYHNLLKSNFEFARLVDKQRKFKEGVLRGQTFSKDDEKRMTELQDKKASELWQRYYTAYPMHKDFKKSMRPLDKNKPMMSQEEKFNELWQNFFKVQPAKE